MEFVAYVLIAIYVIGYVFCLLFAAGEVDDLRRVRVRVIVWYCFVQLFWPLFAILAYMSRIRR
jgi:hypothetical protein